MAGEELGHKKVHVFHAPLAVAGEKFAEARRRWRELSVVVQRLYNDWHAHWLSAHLARGSDVAVRDYMAANKAWHDADKATRGPKPKCEVKCVDKEISNGLYHTLRRLHPQLHTRVCVLAMNKIAQRMGKVKGSNSAYPRWMLILAGLGEYPASSRPLPIPFDKDNCKLIPPAEDGKPWQIEFRLELSEPGKSICETFDLRVGGRHKENVRQALWKMVGGEWKFSGSDIVHTERDGWTAMICCQMPKPEKPDVDPKRIAVLRPGRKRPVWLRLPGGRMWHLKRYGGDVAHVRRSLGVQRSTKSEAYRHASSSRKGHGRGRAIVWRQKLTNRWRDFVKTWNGQLAAAVVKECIANGCGTLVVFQPTGSRREDRFLATVGKLAHFRDGTLWDWYQMKALLERECDEFGIALLVRKSGREGSGGEQSPATARKPESPSENGGSVNGKAPKGYVAGRNGKVKADRSKSGSQAKAAKGGSGGRRRKA